MKSELEELFENINKLKEWYVKDIITLDMYFHIKSKIIDKYLEDIKEAV